MQFYGTELFTVIGPAENIKITTPIDFYTFKAYLEVKNSLNIMGL
jgi:2-C-methyl-D-erythritol 4-phosphate cytidylyltransferase 1